MSAPSVQGNRFYGSITNGLIEWANNNHSFEHLTTPLENRKNRQLDGHSYTKEGRVGTTRSSFDILKSKIIAHTTSFFSVITFGLAKRNHTFCLINKRAWREVSTGKTWQSVYIKNNALQDMRRGASDEMSGFSGRFTQEYVNMRREFQTFIATASSQQTRNLLRNTSALTEAIDIQNHRRIVINPLFKEIVTSIPIERISDLVGGIKWDFEKSIAAMTILLENSDAWS